LYTKEWEMLKFEAATPPEAKRRRRTLSLSFEMFVIPLIEIVKRYFSVGSLDINMDIKIKHE